MSPQSGNYSCRSEHMKRRLAGDVPGDTVIFKRSKEPDSIPLESCEKILEKMEPGIRAYYTGTWPESTARPRNTGVHGERKQHRDKKYREAAEAPPKTADILYREWKKQHD